jgi:hypothetical protein
MNWKTLLAGLVGSLGAFCVVAGVADIYARRGTPPNIPAGLIVAGLA